MTTPLSVASARQPLGDSLPLIPAFRFEADRLGELARRHAQAFAANAPFPHVAIPDFLPAEVAGMLAAEFPRPGDIHWHLAGPGDVPHSGDPNVEKIGTSNEASFPPLIRHLMHELNSGVFVRFVEELTGCRNLIPDPLFAGGGMHSTGRGGRLMIHADGSRHANPRLHQILNLIYYLTPDWQESWGGALELWDKDLKGCVSRVPPMFNTLLVFLTGSNSYHGHPHPLQSPPGVRRNSLAIYYYTTDRPPGANYAGYRNYADWVRTGEMDGKASLYHLAKGGVRRYLPPAVVNGIATLVRRARS